MLHGAQYFYILIAFALSLLIHYLVIQLTHRKGIFLDEHDKIQKMHAIPTPRIGGLGVFLSSMFILNDHALGGYLLLSSIPAFIAGFLEDYSGKISPEQRLAIICLSPVMAFIMIPDVTLTSLSLIHLPSAVGMMTSSFIIVALVNGVNFTDGQNGLASGTTLITFATLAGITFILGSASLLFICLVMTASILAFLLYNFPKGRIFLGDGGAYFLGFMTATVAIVTTQQHATSVSVLLLPAILIYPLWEVLFSTLRKVLFDHISPFHSDDYHLHQLLFRNRSGGKGYMPAMFILPVQILVSVCIILFRNDTSGLLLVIFGYVLLYCVVYFRERRVDAVRNRVRQAA